MHVHWMKTRSILLNVRYCSQRPLRNHSNLISNTFPHTLHLPTFPRSIANLWQTWREQVDICERLSCHLVRWRRGHRLHGGVLQHGAVRVHRHHPLLFAGTVSSPRTRSTVGKITRSLYCQPTAHIISHEVTHHRSVIRHRSHTGTTH